MKKSYPLLKFSLNQQIIVTMNSEYTLNKNGLDITNTTTINFAEPTTKGEKEIKSSAVARFELLFLIIFLHKSI